MSKVEVLYLAADPNSAPQNGNAARLMLDEEAEEIRRKIRNASLREHLEFQSRWAVRTEDLLLAMRERRPQVVHFSGHGGSEGVILVGKDGRPHAVPGEALARLFTVYPGDIRLVVLNACFSGPQAKAIANVVGCAIGTRGPISDEAAIDFAASFYGGIAFGESVQTAYDAAAALLAMNRVSDEECPELVVGDGIDPSQLVLIPGPARKRPRKRTVPPPLDPPPQEPTAPEPGSGSNTGDSTDAAGQGTGVQNAAPQKLGLLSVGPVDDIVREEADRPTPRAGWERSFIGAVWGLSLAGAMLLGTGFAWALGLSLVSLLITAGLLRYSRSPASRGAMRRGPAGGVAAMASAAVVLGGAALLKSAEHSHDVPLAVCAGSGTARPLGLLPPGVASRAAGEESAATGELADANAHYQAGDHAAAFPAFYGAAVAGNAEAMSYVGTAYLCGEGTEQKPDSAIYWLRRAEDRGNARAMFALGVAHETGQGFNRSKRWAKHWYDRSAEKDYVDAMRSLGRLHRADGAADSALAWYEKAADAGSVEALVDAGRIYEQGRLAGGRDPDSAFVRYRRAADEGSAQAMFELGRIYQEGIIVPRDLPVARVWYERSAAAGSADAMNQLGILHQKGLGVPPSRDEALRWYRQAADAGSAEARSNLAALESGWWGWLRRWF